jgi:hypothetical protein
MSPAHYEMLQQHKDRIDRRRLIDWQCWPDTRSQQQYAELAFDTDDKSRPDVEEDALIAWGLAQGNGTKGLDVNIDVLCGDGPHFSRCRIDMEVGEADTHFDWQHDISDDTLEHIMQVCGGYNFIYGEPTQRFQAPVKNIKDRSLRIWYVTQLSCR